jgi:chaperonin cofactor prefoldin
MKKLLLGIIAINFAFISFNLVFSSSLEAKTFEEITYEQTLEIEKGKTKSYITSRGEKFSVGQTIQFGTLNRPETLNYDYIYRDIGSITLKMEAQYDGVESEIKKIEWKKEFSKTSVWIHTKGSRNFKYLIADFEAAIKFGEIVTSIMTKKKAIDKLKERKELLDLEIITQDEYDELKNSLTPFIMTD